MKMGFIRDSIHGDLHLTDFELKIIDTVETVSYTHLRAHET